MSGWVRVENTMPESLKVAPLTDRSFRLWMHALCYCSRAKTDGRVPAALVLSLSPSANRRSVDELVNAGLFEPVEDGYLVHDYLDYNPSRARIRELKDAAKERTARWRNGDGDVTRHKNEGDGDVTDNEHITPHARDRSVPSSAVLQEIYDYWKVKCRKTRAQFTDERRAKVCARLKRYTVEDVKLGIDGAAANPPRDRDSGFVHDDLVSICRNDAQLERYMERAQPRQVVPLHGPSALLRKLDEAGT